MIDPDRWRYFLAGMVAGVALVVGLAAFVAAWVGRMARLEPSTRTPATLSELERRIAIDRALGVLIQSAMTIAELEKRLPHESEVDPGYLEASREDLIAQRRALFEMSARC